MGFLCTICVDGYVFGKNSDVCLDFCATGFKEENKRCIGPSAMVGEFLFNDAVSAWKSVNSWADE
jgi:hypothetical protein